MSTSETTATASSAFSIKQIHKTKRSLSFSAGNNAALIGTLTKKFNLRIAVHNKLGRKKNELSEEEEEWLENFLERSDITHTIPRRSIVSTLDWTAVKGSIS